MESTIENQLQTGEVNPVNILPAMEVDLEEVDPENCFEPLQDIEPEASRNIFIAYYVILAFDLRVLIQIFFNRKSHASTALHDSPHFGHIKAMPGKSTRGKKSTLYLPRRKGWANARANVYTAERSSTNDIRTVTLARREKPRRRKLQPRRLKKPKRPTSRKNLTSNLKIEFRTNFTLYFYHIG